MIDGDPNQGDGKPKVYAVEAGVAFVDALAIGLCDLSGGDPLALAGMTVMLPTRGLSPTPFCAYATDRRCCCPGFWRWPICRATRTCWRATRFRLPSIRCGAD